MNGSYFRFLTAAFALHEEGIVEIRELGSGAEEQAPELLLEDLLFEQAAAEQAHTSGRYLDNSIGRFERFVPVWVHRPEPEEWERMPDDVRELYRKFDGSRRLEEIFSFDDEARSRESELLMLQIGKEAVALIPAPLAELEAAAGRRETPDAERWWNEVF